MNTNKVLVAAMILAGVTTVGAAQAKGKRPTVCLAFAEVTAIVDGDSQKVVICEDGKKPVVLTSYTIATVKDEDGVAVRAAIGWR